MKAYICVMFIFFLLACSSEDPNKQKDNEQNEPTTGKPYFDYDQADHYISGISNAEIPGLLESIGPAPMDTLKMAVITGLIPTSINDNSFVSRLEEIDYTRSNIDKSKFERINEIFQ